MSNESVVVVVGLGEIGRPLFNLIEKAGVPCVGVDLQPVEVKQDVSLLHLCIPFDVPLGFVETAVAYADKYRPRLMVVNSTVRPGTTREIEQRSSVPTVYSPVRGKHTKMEAELTHYQKFVAGTRPQAVSAAVDHFGSLGMKTATMATPETLELAKLLETTYFGLLIAWAQEMERMGRKVGADYFELANFFAEVGYLPSHVFVPGFIGGHCVMPNIGILKTLFESGMLDAISTSNELKAKELGDTKVAERVRPIERDPK